MSDEIQGTPEPLDEVQETESTDEQVDSTEEEPKVDEASAQLEAQLQKERAAREKAEKALADKAYKERNRLRSEDVPEDEDEVSEEDKPITRKELHAFMARERKSEISDIVSQMSDNDKERELVILTHQNRSFPPDLSLKEQLEEAYLIANKSKVLGENQELKRAVAGKKNASTDASGSFQDSPKGSQPKLSPADGAEYARLGLKWNSALKRYEKESKNGKFVKYKDGRTEFIKG